MKSIRERLEEIVDEKIRFHLTDTVREKRSGFLDYGRDKDEKTIVDFLVDYAFGLEGFVRLSNCWSRQKWKNNNCSNVVGCINVFVHPHPLSQFLG